MTSKRRKVESLDVRADGKVASLSSANYNLNINAKTSVVSDDAVCAEKPELAKCEVVSEDSKTDGESAESMMTNSVKKRNAYSRASAETAYAKKVEPANYKPPEQVSATKWPSNYHKKAISAKGPIEALEGSKKDPPEVTGDEEEVDEEIVIDGGVARLVSNSGSSNSAGSSAKMAGRAARCFAKKDPWPPKVASMGGVNGRKDPPKTERTMSVAASLFGSEGAYDDSSMEEEDEYFIPPEHPEFEALFDANKAMKYYHLSNNLIRENIKILGPGLKNNHFEETDDDVLKRRLRRQNGTISRKISRLVTINVFRDWPEITPFIKNPDVGCSALNEDQYYDYEIARTELQMASAAVASTVREMGVAILSCTNQQNSEKPSPSPLENSSYDKKPPALKNDIADMKSPSRAAATVSELKMPAQQHCGTPKTPSPGPEISPSMGGVTLFPPQLMSDLLSKAKQIEKEVCDRLDEKGLQWRVQRKIGPAAKSATDTSPSDKAFSFHEVASRGPGRLDVRYGMDKAPFNNPNVINNPILQPVIEQLLGGREGKPCLVYAGLIFSFPHSPDQAWHMDGATLFPECKSWLDLPTYALNIFIPLDDITDEIGPTEFIPESHLSTKAMEVNANLMEWCTNQVNVEEWLDYNFCIGPLLKKGDALIYDYRVCHRGTKNLSDDKTRHMLYLMYARPWFKEHLNFGKEKLFL